MQQNDILNSNSVKYLTSEEIVKMFRISMGTLVRWRNLYGLPYIQMSSYEKIIYDRDAVKSWLKKQERCVPLRIGKGLEEKREMIKRKFR